jgi:ATP-dependent Lon protease
LEEKEYPQYFEAREAENDDDEIPASGKEKPSPKQPTQQELKEQHLTFEENQRGVTFDSLLGPYLKGAGKITITDPYIRLFFQARNLMELLEAIARYKADEDEIAVHLVTAKDEFKAPQQLDYFTKMQESCAPIGIQFTWEFDETNTIHARHIVTDHGWKILLDRGLDIFQHYEMNDAFAMSNKLQRYRTCKAFEATFIRDALQQ